jgi:Ni2+-binding GTPase involved in maturation of urease and hydrogenase
MSCQATSIALPAFLARKSRPELGEVHNAWEYNNIILPDQAMCPPHSGVCTYLHHVCDLPLTLPSVDCLIVSSVGEQVNSTNPDLVVRSITLESLTDGETDTMKIFHYTNWPQYGKL